jgi:3-mercaptopyruvate sulfurtransferase SseA
VRALQGLGYRNVKEYRGGKQEWMENGLPTESSPPKIFESLIYVLGG